jgi:hypothetical protein
MRAVWQVAVLTGLMFAATGKLGGGSVVAAEQVDGLYQARVHVTGQEEPARSKGSRSAWRMCWSN